MRVNNTPIPTDSCTALVALERAGYKVNSECRNGYCGACRLKA
ncbi:2Fe-2S iron-sulfur cluster-binding protein, partial [Vibrio breoganii]